MRRLLLLSALLLLVAVGHAQESMLAKIRKANATAKTIEAPLTNTLTKAGKTTVQKGTLYFISPDKFAALFETGDHMIVNGNRLKMDIGVFRGKFKLRNGGMMQSLTNIFLYGFQGRCEELAKQNDFSVTVYEEGPYQQVYCTNQKKSILGLGYKTVIYNFDKETLMLREIILIDNSDNVDIYTTAKATYNGEIDESHFVF